MKRNLLIDNPNRAIFVLQVALEAAKAMILDRINVLQELDQLSLEVCVGV